MCNKNNCRFFIICENIIQDFSHFMNEGGPFMWVILNMWLLGIIISFERWISFWRYDGIRQEFTYLPQKDLKIYK